MDFRQFFEQNPGLAQMAGNLRQHPESPFPVLTAKIKLTWRCNLRCRVCSYWRQTAGGHQPEDLMSVEQIKRILTGLSNQGLRKIHFSGGEVLLRKDLEEILGCACRLGLQVNLTTNGTLLDKEQARILVESRLHCVTISIDGATAREHDSMRGVKGAWRRTWKGIELLQSRKHLKGRGPKLAVNTIVTRKNIDRLPLLQQLLQEQGVTNWRLLPVRTGEKKLRPTVKQWAAAADWLADQSILTRRLLDWHSARNMHLAAKGFYAGDTYDESICFAPWFHLFIDADGAVYTCCGGRKKMPSYGNLRQSPLEGVLAAKTRQEICATMASGHFFDPCRACDDFLKENQAFAQMASQEVRP